MKKTAITLLACAALGVAYGQDEQQKSGFGLELNAAYNFALKDIDTDPDRKIDTYGADLTAMYSVNEHHSVNVRFGWTTGDDEENLGSVYWVDDPEKKPFFGTDEYEVQNLYIMPGYRYTGEIRKGFSIFGGFNVGVSRVKLTDKISGGGRTDKLTREKWGFAWSVETGITQKITSHGQLALAVQLQGMQGRPEYEGYKVKSQLNLGVRLGYSCQF